MLKILRLHLGSFVNTGPDLHDLCFGVWVCRIRTMPNLCYMYKQNNNNKRAKTNNKKNNTITYLINDKYAEISKVTSTLGFVLIDYKQCLIVVRSKHWCWKVDLSSLSPVCAQFAVSDFQNVWRTIIGFSYLIVFKCWK